MNKLKLGFLFLIIGLFFAFPALADGGHAEGGGDYLQTMIRDAKLSAIWVLRNTSVDLLKENKVKENLIKLFEEIGERIAKDLERSSYRFLGEQEREKFKMAGEQKTFLTKHEPFSLIEINLPRCQELKINRQGAAALFMREGARHLGIKEEGQLAQVEEMGLVILRIHEELRIKDTSAEVIDEDIDKFFKRNRQLDENNLAHHKTVSLLLILDIINSWDFDKAGQIKIKDFIGVKTDEDVLRLAEIMDGFFVGVCWASRRVKNGQEHLVNILMRQEKDIYYLAECISKLYLFAEGQLAERQQRYGAWERTSQIIRGILGIPHIWALKAASRALDDKDNLVRSTTISSIGDFIYKNPQIEIPYYILTKIAWILEDKNEKDFWVRKDAAITLAKAKYERGLEIIHEILQDEKDSLSEEDKLLEALQIYRDKSSVGVILRFIERIELKKDLWRKYWPSRRGWLLWEAFRTLGMIGDCSVVPSILSYATNGDEDEGIRKCAIEVLGELHDPQALKPLVKILEETKDSDMRGAASYPVRQIIIAMKERVTSPEKQTGAETLENALYQTASLTKKELISRLNSIFEGEKEWGIRENIRETLVDLGYLKEKEKYIGWEEWHNYRLPGLK